MTESSATRAKRLIENGDPEYIKSILFRPCACMGAIEGESLCRCNMLRKEVGNHISLFALLKLGKISRLKNNHSLHD